LDASPLSLPGVAVTSSRYNHLGPGSFETVSAGTKRDIPAASRAADGRAFDVASAVDGLSSPVITGVTPFSVNAGDMVARPSERERCRVLGGWRRGVGS
jgi:hypothetical protein